MITLEILKTICPKTKTETLEQFVEPLNGVCEHFEINTPERVAAFLAQTAHESGGFNFLQENLNYSADGLQKIFHKYFPDAATAAPYARQPEKIANRVYGGRMGNGTEETGDGWKFHGRGLIQLTGKTNYQRFASDFDLSLDDAVEYAGTIEGACASAAWFWNANGLNQFADNGDFVTLTKKINGGTIGLADRQHHYDQALAALNVQ